MDELIILLESMEPFFILVSTRTAQPFLLNGACYLYTDSASMQDKLEYLRLLGYGVVAVSVVRSRNVLLEEIATAGADTVILNDRDDGGRIQCAKIENLTTVYPDDATSDTVPLVNRALCRRLNEVYQDGEEEDLQKKLEVEALMGKTHFVVPIDHAASSIQGTPVFPMLQGSRVIPVFTDYRRCRAFIENLKSKTEYDGWLLTLEDMRNVMNQHPGIGFRLNPQGIALDIERQTRM